MHGLQIFVATQALGGFIMFLAVYAFLLWVARD